MPFRFNRKYLIKPLLVPVDKLSYAARLDKWQWMLAAYFLTRKITSFRTITSNALIEISERDRDLTRRLQEGQKDELGMLTHGFNQFTDNIHQSMQKVEKVIHSLTRASERMYSISANSKTASNTQREGADQITVAIHEMTTTIKQVANNAVDASDAAQSANSAVSESLSTVELSRKNIDLLVQENQTAMEVARKLEKESKKKEQC